MSTITRQQAVGRWDTLPDNIREAMTLETNSKLVWNTAANEHLPKEKLHEVSKLVGYVLMGFIHPEDLARELHENLGIDIRIAASIADPINKKVFQPLREELEKIYSPMTEEVGQAGGLQPVLMDSITSPAGQAPQTKEAIKPGVVSSVPKFFQTGQIPKPAAPPPAPVPKPAAQSMPAVSLPALSLSKRSNPPAAPTAAMPSAAPFMLHTESKSQPLSPSKSGFKIGLSEEQFGKMEQKWSAPPRPAQIETGFTPQSKTEAPKPDARVVHYSEMRTPVPQAPSYKNASRPAAPKPFPPSGAGMSVPKPHAPNKNVEVPAPPSPQKPATAQAPPQKPAEPAKQEEMLPGKPEEKELPEPKV